MNEVEKLFVQDFISEFSEMWIETQILSASLSGRLISSLSFQRCGLKLVIRRRKFAVADFISEFSEMWIETSVLPSVSRLPSHFISEFSEMWIETKSCAVCSAN